MEITKFSHEVINSCLVFYFCPHFACLFYLLFNDFSCFIVRAALSAACMQRGGSLPQAGASQRLGREPSDAVSHKVSYELHPRLWQTARCLLVFFIFHIFYSCFNNYFFRLGTVHRIGCAFR